MLLEGHEGEIFGVDFHPEGQYLASAGFDRKICKYFFQTLNVLFVRHFHPDSITQNEVHSWMKFTL